MGLGRRRERGARKDGGSFGGGGRANGRGVAEISGNMSRRRGRVGGALAMVAMAAAGAAVAAGVARAAEYRNVDYTGNGSRLQFLDLYVPENATTRTDRDVVRTFLFVHGTR